MKVAVLALSLLVIAACSQSGPPVAARTPTPAVSVSPSPTASSSPIESPSAGPSPSSVVSQTVTVSPVGQSLSCRLPVVWDMLGDTTERLGFLTFPGGTLTQDPSAPARALFYDRAYQRWLPVWRQAVSADGTRYAYDAGNLGLHTGGKLHVVDVSTGADRVVYVDSAGIVYKVVDFSSGGIYVTAGDSESRSSGMWYLNLAGGSPQLINNNIESPALGGGFGWGLDFNAGDPSPAPGGFQSPVNRMLRVDLTSGVATPWFYRPGADIYIVGFDSAGNPLVGVLGATDATGRHSFEVWSVSSSSAAASRLFVGSNNAPIPSSVSAIDRHGVWLDGSSSTVWLYASGSMQIAATVDSVDFHIAGGCIP